VIVLCYVAWCQAVTAAKLTVYQSQCVIKICLHLDFPHEKRKCAELWTLPTRYVLSQVPLDAFLLFAACCDLLPFFVFLVLDIKLQLSSCKSASNLRLYD